MASYYNYAEIYGYTNFYLRFTSFKNSKPSYTYLHNGTFLTDNINITDYGTAEPAKINQRSAFALPIPTFTDETGFDYEGVDPTVKSLTLDSIIGSQIKNLVLDNVGTVVGNINAGIDRTIVSTTQQRFKAGRPRTFTFSWKFKPQSSQEAKMIAEMFFVIKMNSLPTTIKYQESDVSNIVKVMDEGMSSSINKGNTVLDSIVKGATNIFELVDMPDYWIIEPSRAFKRGTSNYSLPAWFFAIKPCFVTNIQASFGEGDFVDFYHDGYPTEMSMSITFTEMVDLRREDFYTIPLTDG